MGGLGNQLFQLFAIIAVSIRENQQFVLPSNNASRNRGTYWDSFLRELSKYVVHFTQSNLLSFAEQSFEYSPLPIPTSNTILLQYNGYFQSYRYFDDVKQTIFRLIKLREQQDTLRKSLPTIFETTQYDKIDIDSLQGVITPRSYENQLYKIRPRIKIAMHFRLGDYKQLQHAHPVLPVTYYINAINEIIENSKFDKEFDIFVLYEETDREEVMQKLHEIKSQITLSTIRFIHIIDICNIPLTDWQQMLFMSLCDIQIIANSTFSWFGGYFSETDLYNANVYYPEIWFGPALVKTHNTADLFPTNWNCVSCFPKSK